MGKPAARIGDTTSHGGSIVVGAPTVLIGGKPAARANDMHVCPMMNPGVPPPPHVGGPILLGSPTVLICGQMAARMGDMAQCSGPPDSIIVGCPTVLIGEGGAGGGGGGGPAGAAASAAMAGKDPQSEEDHYLKVKFTDKKGNPIRGVNYAVKTPDNKEIKGTLGGQIKKTGVKEGNYEIQLISITNAQWSKNMARDGETVKMTAEAVGFESIAKATFAVLEKDSNKTDRMVAVIKDIAVNGEKVEAEWQYVWDNDEDAETAGENEQKEYSSPEYYFTVTIDKYCARSGLLKYKDFIELEAKDNKGEIIKNELYRIILPNGEIREGKLDNNGYAKIENVPPGKWDVSFPDLGKPKLN